ncbi:MAG: ribosome maturation factor RimP [Firmicutes bacterium]|nr:ribosome maturation factor RimP [Bacillota bacterium]
MLKGTPGQGRPAPGPSLTSRQISEAVDRLAGPIVAGLELDLVDVEFVKENGRWHLRITIDRPGGVTLDHCEAVAQAIGRELDRLDLIPQRYYLEVSSPGLERPLKKNRDFQHFAGRTVQVTTYAPVEGRKTWQGTLLGLQGDDVRLQTEGREIAIPRSAVAKARLLADLPPLAGGSDKR